MPQGLSGRIVLEVDPDLKRRLYSVLAREGLTMKGWFVDAVGSYLARYTEVSLAPPGKRLP